MLDRLEFYLTEAYTALRRNTWMTFAAVSTAAMALFLLGGLGMGFTRLNAWLDSLKKDYQVRVFLTDGLSPEAIQAGKKKVEAMPGVLLVTYVPKEEGLKDFAKKNPNIDVSDLASDNPLPDAFHITLKSLELAPQIKESLAKQDFVDKQDGVQASDDLRSSVEQIVRYSRLLGLSIAAIMFLTGGILIYNAIRLTIVARRREIKIMELVGATMTTVRIPLLMEGTFHGLVGGLLAYGLLYATVDISGRVLKSLDAMAAVQPLPGQTTLWLLLASGSLYGFACSFLAARRPRSESA